MLRKTKHQENIKLCKKINYSKDSRDRRSHSLMDSKRIQYSKRNTNISFLSRIGKRIESWVETSAI